MLFQGLLQGLQHFPVEFQKRRHRRPG
jgi:hypothetical protein